jgi:hypothetical protein
MPSSPFWKLQSKRKQPSEASPHFIQGKIIQDSRQKKFELHPKNSAKLSVALVILICGVQM